MDRPSRRPGVGSPLRPDRRAVLRAVGTAGVGTVLGAVVGTTSVSAAIDISNEGDYDVWQVSGKELYDLSDGETVSNVLVDQTADGASLTIRAQNNADWTVKNVGFQGVGQAGADNRFHLQVSASSGDQGLVENVWANGKSRNGQAGSALGGVYVRARHAGHLDVRHTYIEGFGNNGLYGSGVGKDGGNNGSVAVENCYHRDNTSSQFRIGSPESVVRNCVGVIDDPDGARGAYPGSNGNLSARGVWAKHFRNQRIEDSSFYVSPEDARPTGVFLARYIEGRSHGEEAVAAVTDCQVNESAPTLRASTGNADVGLDSVGESPSVSVIDDGVPLSAKMAARGNRSMPDAVGP